MSTHKPFIALKFEHSSVTKKLTRWNRNKRIQNILPITTMLASLQITNCKVVHNH